MVLTGTICSTLRDGKKKVRCRYTLALSGDHPTLITDAVKQLLGTGETKKELIDNTPRKSYHSRDCKFSRFYLLKNVLRPRGLKSRGLFVAILPSGIKMTDRKSAVRPSTAPGFGIGKRRKRYGIESVRGQSPLQRG